MPCLKRNILPNAFNLMHFFDYHFIILDLISNLGDFFQIQIPYNFPTMPWQV